MLAQVSFHPYWTNVMHINHWALAASAGVAVEWLLCYFLSAFLLHGLFETLMVRAVNMMPELQMKDLSLLGERVMASLSFIPTWKLYQPEADQLMLDFRPILLETHNSLELIHRGKVHGSAWIMTTCYDKTEQLRLALTFKFVLRPGWKIEELQVNMQVEINPLN